MKILLTVHQFFPEYSSGTEVLTLSVARELLRRGHEVRVFAGHPAAQNLTEEQRFDEYPFEGIFIYRFHHAYTPMCGQDSMVELSYDNHLAVRCFERIVNEFRPDLVHGFHLNRLGGGLIDVAVEAGIPAFFTPTDFWVVCHTAQLVLSDGRLCEGPTAHGGNCVKHLAMLHHSQLVSNAARWVPSTLLDWGVLLTEKGFFPPYPYRKEVEALGRRLKVNVSRIKQLSGILSPNSFMTDVLTRYGVMPHLITEAAYGVDVVSSEPNRPRGPPRSPFRIGFIGTLVQHKGCHVLVDAFKAFRPGQALLKIYGRHSDFPEYSAQLVLAARDRNDIEFCGVFPNGDIDRILADLDVLVVPSMWFENTPLVVYSAHAAKCPVVASDFPGLSRVIEHEKNGLLFKPGDSRALAIQLRRLLDEPGMLQRLSANSQSPKSTAAYVDELLQLWSKSIRS